MSVMNRYATPVCQFTQFKATKVLEELAKTPFDLTKAGNVTPDRIKAMWTEAAGIRMIYAMQRLDDKVLKALEELATEANALEKMKDMQAGEITNCLENHASENRAVLHTAMRDLFDKPQTAAAAMDATKRAKAEHAKLEAFCKELDGLDFTDMVMVGIGGSDLGPRCLYLSLEAYRRPDRRCHFISNVDPDDAADVLRGLDLKKTLCVVVSKSGSTLETLSNEEIVRRAFKDAGCNPDEHMIAATGEGSPMDNPERYRKSFYIWDYVGGRFSTTSMVGGVGLSFALGYDGFKRVLKGCHEMDRVALNPNIKENLPLLLALIGIWNHNFLNYPTLAIIPYSQALHRFAAHLQQCDMESNGKCIDRKGQSCDFSTGPIVWGEPGTNAQHSFYQLIHQGTDIVPLDLMGFSECQRGVDMEVQGTSSHEKLCANLLAQSLALATGQDDENPNKVFPGNRPSTLILAKKLTPEIMGALWALYEHKIAFQGFIWDINSFDQEGVQLGKVLAKKVLGRIQHRRDPSAKAETCELGDALVDHLMDL